MNKVISREYVEKNYISKSVVKQKYLELLWEQNEGKNIVENRFKIELLKELMGETKDE